MDKPTFEALREFAKPYYAQKDEMHGLRHVRRLLSRARELAEDDEVDDDLLVFGAYFHGFIYSDEPDIKKFLSSLGYDHEQINRIIKVAWESGKGSTPETREGAYLHDSHLIEGGKNFEVAKSLVTGSLRGQTLEQTLDFIESKLLGKFKCVTPKAQSIYAEKERFTREFVAELRKHL